ncbi:pyridoxamine 5'-phosphate oxidase family protein [Polycladomyces sp. WAk]|uniref:Pyridoxamine 5'-phosphate oxidase family protein n=1 Tax=Polycladomyces zharkentensis TaxID=2807616 RepID=A0ABS2WJH7_9BACL|nr:pyridoxamine 5'-phosphate oxidase family protein [Polycladomyces sp. WAk]
MGKLFPALLPEHEAFIKKQRLFFVGSAPLSKEGHINLSAKGYDVLRIFSPTEVVYLDLTGSGNETSAHLKENGRITLMFVALEGPPMILRLYGRGRVILPDSSEWNQLIHHFDLLPGARQIIHVNIREVKTSCGYSVPYFSNIKPDSMVEDDPVSAGRFVVFIFSRHKNHRLILITVILAHPVILVTGDVFCHTERSGILGAGIYSLFYLIKNKLVCCTNKDHRQFQLPQRK